MARFHCKMNFKHIIKILFFTLLIKIFIFLLALSVYNSSTKETLSIKKATSTKLYIEPFKFELKIKSRSEINYYKHLFKYFYQLKAFLIDIDLLNDLVNNYAKDVYRIEKSFLFRKSFTFGLSSKYAHRLSHFMVFQKHFQCNVKPVNGTLKHKKLAVVTNIYLNCKFSINIQFAVFYRRKSFYWIGNATDDNDFNSITKPDSIWFGDTPRAVSVFHRRLVKINRLKYVYVPSNMRKFLFDYSHSVFVECNNEKNVSMMVYNRNKKNSIKRNRAMLHGFRHVIDIIEFEQKNWWLDGSTLLGWYKDCNIASNVKDIDISMKITDYDNAFIHKFLGNRKVHLASIYGFVDDSFKFLLTNDRFNYNISFSYNWNQTHQYTVYHTKEIKYKIWSQNVFDLCSAELISVKVNIPCDPKKYLKFMYSVTNVWNNSMVNYNSWKNIDFKSGDKWPSNRRNRVIKHFISNGTFSHYE